MADTAPEKDPRVYFAAERTQPRRLGLRPRVQERRNSGLNPCRRRPGHGGLSHPCPLTRSKLFAARWIAPPVVITNSHKHVIMRARILTDARSFSRIYAEKRSYFAPLLPESDRFSYNAFL